MIEHGCKIEEEVQDMQSDVKKNIQETNSDKKENRTQINNLDEKEEINIQPEQNEETRIQKSGQNLGPSRTTLNAPTFKT